MKPEFELTPDKEPKNCRSRLVQVLRITGIVLAILGMMAAAYFSADFQSRNVERDTVKSIGQH